MKLLSPVAVSLLAVVPHVSSAEICGNNGVDIYKDATCSSAQRTDDLLSRMSWTDKVKQLGGIRQILGEDMSFNKTKFDIFNEAQNGNIGYGNQFNPALPALSLVNELRENQTASGLGIPYVLVSDSINGIYIFNGTLFPSTLSMASSFNIPLYGSAIASIREECRAIGINWVLSPELDVATDPRYGRVGETYGEDPYLNGEFGLKYVQTMQVKDESGFMKVAATIKHFVYGWETGGVNTAHQYGGLNHIYNDMLPPYIKIINEASPASLMASYASLDRVPMSANKFMLQRVLRDDLGFEGIIMSDAGALVDLSTEFKIASTSQDAAILAVKAGMQMELSPGVSSATQTLVNVTDDSELTSMVSNATRKILELKFNLGLFDLPLPSISNASKILRAPAHLEAARNISRESIVLLQNDDTLPLKQNKTSQKVAVLGPYASIIDPGSYAAHSTSDKTHGNSLLQSLQAKFGSVNILHEPGVDFLDRTNTTGISKAVSAAKSAGLAIVNIGSLSVYSSDPLYDKRTDGEFFTHADLGFPGLQQELLDAVLDTGVPTILVLSGGQAFVLNNSTLRANAILHTFLAGEYTGDSVVEILTGKVNPSGKLPISLPQANGAFPVAYNWLPSDNHGGNSGEEIYGSSAWQFPAITITPPMAFGFGLSYTSFNMTEFQTEEIETEKTGEKAFKVSINVTNSGDVIGKEVLQLYFSQDWSTIELPIKRLIRFEKVELRPGQAKTVTFVIPQKEMGYYVNMEWMVERGDYTFHIGSSSKSVDLQERTVTITY